MELGSRIRTIRKNQGLSLEQLAAKSGVALGTLSRIENGKGSGTFRTHQKIAEAFGLTIPEFYKGLEPAEEEAIAVEASSEEAQTFMYDEKASAILLTTQVARRQMFPQLIVLKPGGKTALEQYHKGTERWLFGLEGIVEVGIGEKSYRISAGGTLYFKAHSPHFFSNPDQAVAKVISVTSPAAL